MNPCWISMGWQLDDNGLPATRVLGRQQRISLGAVITELARKALAAPPPDPSLRDELARARTSCCNARPWCRCNSAAIPCISSGPMGSAC